MTVVRLCCRRRFFFAGDETGEDQDGLADAGFAQADALFGAGDAEPVGAGFFEGFGDLGAAVAVGVSFDDAENFSRRGALFRFRIHVGADGLKLWTSAGSETSAQTGRIFKVVGFFGARAMGFRYFLGK